MKHLASLFLLVLCLVSLAIAAQGSHIYLPLVSRMPMPSPSATAPVARPLRGYWRGANADLTVSADGGYVCQFHWFQPGGACGLGGVRIDYCRPVDAAGHFSYSSGPPGAVATFEGHFTSPSTANGTWRVEESEGDCAEDGTWSASATFEGPFNCSQAGSVEICAWVGNPTPSVQTIMVVYGQLLDGGRGRDGLPMRALWSFQTTTATCDGETGSEGAGLTRCWLWHQGRAGHTVTVDVTITYHGQEYTASTWYTPQ